MMMIDDCIALMMRLLILMHALMPYFTFLMRRNATHTDFRVKERAALAFYFRCRLHFASIFGFSRYCYGRALITPT